MGEGTQELSDLVEFYHGVGDIARAGKEDTDMREKSRRRYSLFLETIARVCVLPDFHGNKPIRVENKEQQRNGSRGYIYALYVALLKPPCA